MVSAGPVFGMFALPLAVLPSLPFELELDEPLFSSPEGSCAVWFWLLEPLLWLLLLGDLLFVLEPLFEELLLAELLFVFDLLDELPLLSLCWLL